MICDRRKIQVTTENARRIQDLRGEFESFQDWLEAHHPLNLDVWAKLFEHTFVFTGREIVNEFLLLTGYLPGAHDPDCPIYCEITRLKPAWMH